jgi:murein DD-endopeptidase MepM/ murein hydrolase activator NlpD
MISMPAQEAGRALSPWQCLMEGLPRAYAILFFSADARLGWMLLAISLLAPDIGLCGLAGVLAAGALALVLGFDRARVRNGYFLFNPLLVCLTVGWMNRAYAFPWPTFLTLWIAAVLGGFFIALALQQWVGQQFGLSPQSLPATGVAYLLYFLAYTTSGPAAPPMPGPTHGWLDLAFLPPAAQAFFQTFGSMLFEPQAVPGILVFAALVFVSPLAAFVASGSFIVGVGTMSLLGFPFNPAAATWCGFNFLLCGIALGTSYFAPTRTSVFLAFAGAFLCALMALAASSALRSFGLPASALPYNLVVLTLVYALRQRTVAAGLYPSPAPGILPETASRFALLNAIRFPHLHLPALALPLKDECIITQGVDGPLTHRAPWNWALDFEIVRDGLRWHGPGTHLADYYTFDKPALAPCDGTVVAVISHIRDNAPGANNPAENWGNTVVLRHDTGYYVLLAHLRQGSALVVVGQRVVCGQPLARCGNSGRSPIPHLHLQVQDTPWPGAVTRPFCLHHYAEIEPESAQLVYRTSGLPRQNTRLASPVALPGLHAIFSNWLPGEYRYRLTRDDGHSREETVLLDFDEAGRFRLQSRRHAARLSAFLSHQVFYAVDYDGPGDSVLALLGIGLARVPCIADPDCVWQDRLSAVPLQAGPFRRLHELADPFLGPNLLSYDYSLAAGEDAFVIHARLTAIDALPRPECAVRRMSTTVVPQHGVARIEARLWNDANLVVELIDPVLPRRAASVSLPRVEAAPAPLVS